MTTTHGEGTKDLVDQTSRYPRGPKIFEGWTSQHSPGARRRSGPLGNLYDLEFRVGSGCLLVLDVKLFCDPYLTSMTSQRLRPIEKELHNNLLDVLLVD